MKYQKEFQTALHWFCKQVGVPVSLVVDGHLSQTSPTVRRFYDQVGTTLRVLDTGTPWANRAELYIGLLKEAVSKGFVAVYPMQSQKEFQTALHWFCKKVGVPVSLDADGHLSQASPTVRRFCDQVGTTLRVLETGTPMANIAELYIGLIKEAVRRDMRQSNSPMTL